MSAGADVSASDFPFQVSIRRLDGTESLLRLGDMPTVHELRNTIDQAGSAGAFAYRLMTGSGDFLEDPLATLSSFGINSGDSVTMIVQRARDYTKISSFERTVPCESYPNGVLIGPDGTLFVCHFWGQLTRYDAEFSLTLNTKLPGSSPSQMALTPDGQHLLVAFRGHPRKVGMFGPLTGSSCPIPPLVRWLGEDLHEPSGLAVCEDRIFVSNTQRDRIDVFSLADGSSIGRIAGFKHPCGLNVLDGRLLVVADRNNHRVKLLSVETFELVSTLPLEGSELGLSSPNDVAVDSAGNLLVMDTGNERIVAFREDGTVIASVMQGFFKDHGNTYSYLSCNHTTGAIAVSNNDEHSIAVLAPLFADS